MVVDNLALMPDFLDPINLLSYFGTWALIGLLVVVFVESGVLFPILPGDSLLFVAGMMTAGISPASAEGNVADVNFQLWQLLLFIPIAAILGACQVFRRVTGGGKTMVAPRRLTALAFRCRLHG